MHGQGIPFGCLPPLGAPGDQLGAEFDQTCRAARISPPHFEPGLHKRIWGLFLFSVMPDGTFSTLSLINDISKVFCFSILCSFSILSVLLPLFSLSSSHFTCSFSDLLNFLCVRNKVVKDFVCLWVLEKIQWMYFCSTVTIVVFNPVLLPVKLWHSCNSSATIHE